MLTIASRHVPYNTKVFKRPIIKKRELRRDPMFAVYYYMILIRPKMVTPLYKEGLKQIALTRGDHNAKDYTKG